MLLPATQTIVIVLNITFDRIHADRNCTRAVGTVCISFGIRIDQVEAELGV